MNRIFASRVIEGTLWYGSRTALSLRQIRSHSGPEDVGAEGWEDLVTCTPTAVTT